MFEDLCEIYNNLTDDLEMDFDMGESGYTTYRESYNAIKKYTLEVLKNKIKKYEKDSQKEGSKNG